MASPRGLDDESVATRDYGAWRLVFLQLQVELSGSGHVRGRINDEVGALEGGDLVAESCVCAIDDPRFVGDLAEPAG